MLKRTRAVPISFPTIFFACLLLTTCGHAQSGTRSQHVELGAQDPIKILQLLLENQQNPPRSPHTEAGSWVSKLTDIVQTRAFRDVAAETRSLRMPTRNAPAPSPVPLVATTDWPMGPDYFPVPPTSALVLEITPAQIFGIGAQSAH